MLSTKECQNISILPAEPHKNVELQCPHQRSTRGLVADLDTVYLIEHSMYTGRLVRKVETFTGHIQDSNSQTGQVHIVNMCSSITYNNYI